MMNILITGAAGLLGGNLCYLFKEYGNNVIGTYHHSRITIPGIKLVSLMESLSFSERIDCIIHCAAKTNVDECEKDPESAYDVNVNLTRKIIDLANEKDALLLYISTDAVYKDVENVKAEGSILQPLNVYARTKLEAEKVVEQTAKKYFIIRTNIFGFNILEKNSLSEWVMNNLKEKQKINGFYDVFFSPLFANDLFLALKKIVENLGHVNTVLNIGSVNGISKYDFACIIAEKFQLEKKLIAKTSVLDFGFIAKRTMNSVMDSSKFQELFQYNLPSIEESLEHFRLLYKQGYQHTLKSFNTNHSYVKR
jgi:dTDP-4-dehydrorhamnose reductase